jgi:hypothetical protein
MSINRNTGEGTTTPNYKPNPSRNRNTGEMGTGTTTSTNKPWWLQGAKTTTTGVSRGPIGEYSGEANRFANMQETSLNKQAEADANKVLAELIYGAKPKTGSGGGYQNIINSLTGRIGSSNASYDALTNKLNELATASQGRASQAGMDVANYLGTMDPMAGFTRSNQAMTIPTAATSEYLNAIGASPMQTQAVQSLGQQLLDAQLQGANQYSDAMTQSQNAFRQAQIAQALQNSQVAQANAGTNADAYRMQIQAARTKAEQDLLDQILQYRLKAGM